jgi:membrane protease subunit HflK
MRIAAIAGILAALVGIATAATGWVEVAPGEVAVVRRLGRPLPHTWTPGPHLGWPLGIDRIDRIRTDQVRRLEIGLVRTPGPGDAPNAGEFLTGDLNLLRSRCVVQYRVSEPVDYVLRAREIVPLLTRAAEASLTRALGRRGIDGALRGERADVARDLAQALTAAVERYQLGLTVLEVSLTDARPPTEVEADFAAAQAAQSERDRRIQEARAYAETVLPTARSAAQAQLDRARAQADRNVALAKSRAGRFLTLLAESQLARSLTVRRLYRDALRDLLPRVRRKLVLTPHEPLDLSILDVEP